MGTGDDDVCNPCLLERYASHPDGKPFDNPAEIVKVLSSAASSLPLFSGTTSSGHIDPLNLLL
uniref:Uncharacterized protein n=1 Tax=Amphimedon queenslandica TaxID=400682 RepID=A0A1X7VRH7_AMPQE